MLGNHNNNYISKIAKAGKVRRILNTILALFVVLFTLIFTLAAFQESIGSFTITLDRNGGSSGIAIYDNQAFTRPSTRLIAEALMNTDNISGRTIPENVDDIEGSHNGENYIAYTFWIQNATNAPIRFQYYLEILEVSKNVDAAMRVKLYTDSTYQVDPGNEDESSAANVRTGKIYGKETDEHLMEDDTDEIFASQTRVFDIEQTYLPPDAYNKFTIVIWLEGDDPQCTNEILAGYIKMQMILLLLDNG